jgi:hypothetical protein
MLVEQKQRWDNALKLYQFGRGRQNENKEKQRQFIAHKPTYAYWFKNYRTSFNAVVFAVSLLTETNEIWHNQRVKCTDRIKPKKRDKPDPLLVCEFILFNFSDLKKYLTDN